MQFWFLAFFQQCILLGLQQRVSKLTQIINQVKRKTILSVKESTNAILSPLRIFSKSWGEGSKTVAVVKDRLLLRLRMLR